MAKFEPEYKFADGTTEGAKEYVDSIQPLIRQALEAEEKYGPDYLEIIAAQKRKEK